MARKIYFGDFRAFVIEHMKAVKSFEPEAYSKEWFLLRYFRRIIHATESTTEAWRVESSIRSLVRFYVDNIDEKSENGERCKRIYEQYKETVKENQQSKYT